MKKMMNIKRFPHYTFYVDGTVIRHEHTNANRINLSQKKLKQTPNGNGYYTISLIDENGKRENLYLHRIIWEAFIGEIPKGYEIDHVSTNRADCSLSNLRVVPHKINCNNSNTIERYKTANSIDKGKYHKERMQKGRTKESYEEAIKVYQMIVNEKGQCGISMLMREAHIGYPKAKKITESMKK